MEIQEAIEILKLPNFITPLGLSPHGQAALVAIKALERQIPQKCVGEEGYSNCPVCNTSVIGKYCYKCGQKLDWD